MLPTDEIDELDSEEDDVLAWDAFSGDHSEEDSDAAGLEVDEGQQDEIRPRSSTAG